MKLAPVAALALIAGLAACSKKPEPNAAPHAESAAPTNRVEIPSSVRQNLGMTFAKVERRAVAHTLRAPGRFELLPSARREYRTPAPGRVELAVSHLQAVNAGDLLYTLDSPAWRELQDRISDAEAALTQAQARLASMDPLRAAHKRHETSLSDKVGLWTARVAQLRELRDAGGGSAKDLAEAQGTLNATQAELADVMEKDAELIARERELVSEVASAGAKRGLLLDNAASLTGLTRESLAAEVSGAPKWRGIGRLAVHAIAAGKVEVVGVTSGAQVADGGHVLTTLQPDQLRFHARGLQSDLGRVRDGLPARIVPPAGGGAADVTEGIATTLTLGLTADPDERTIEMLAPVEAGVGGVGGVGAPWARAGVSAFLEVTLAGGAAELAVPTACIVRDGVTPVIFRRDPANPDKAIRLEADVGMSDGRWTVIKSGVKDGDEIVLGGVYPLLLATSGSAQKGGHFHSDGTFHEGKD